MRAFLLAGVALFSLAGSSQGQIIIGYGGGGYPWGYNYPYGAFRTGYMSSFPRGPFGVGYPAPFSGGPGYGYSGVYGGAYPYGGGYTFGGAYGGYDGGFTGPLVLPGFTATEQPRMRASLYPAIPLPSREIIAARLGGGEDNRAHVTLDVPAPDAHVWIEGVLMTQTGFRRQFVTPPLTGDGPFTLNVRIEWTDELGTQRRSRAIRVTPGEERTVTVY